MSVQHEPEAGVVPPQTNPSPQTGDPGRKRRAVINWILAVLTIPAAALVMIFAVGAVMSMAACSTGQCPQLGPSGLVYGILFYGAPVIAAVTIILSFFTAFRPRGFAVPLVGLLLLLADFAAIALLF